MFKSIFVQIVAGLKDARNNDLVKWLNYKIMLKYGLFDFVCAKNQLKRNLADSKCVDKATACLFEDPYNNADVLLGEQLLSIYELQPESVSIAVLHP